MNDENINKKAVNSRVLVAPLDWGLGHATRCIPIIHTLLKQNITVFIAAEAAQQILLQKEFQNVTFLPLNGYRITYATSKKMFFKKMLAQLPSIIGTITYEKKWLRALIKTHHIDAVISDNRFGLYNKNIHSIYITHQLHIETGNSLLNSIAQKIHYKYINKYDECWVPDEPGNVNLAGKLSHPKKLPKVPVKYVGALSRFVKAPSLKKTALLIMLSGPEPQRTIFEKILLPQLTDTNYKIIFVRGLPETTAVLQSNNSAVQFFNHLPAIELNNCIQQADLVIARSGYSTVMDLMALQQKAVLVPTPGQTEQEYLAGYLQQQQLFLCQSQENFSLTVAIKAALVFTFKTPDIQNIRLQPVIDNFIQELSFSTSQ